MIGILSMGHGTPSHTDDGSRLGKLWAKIWPNQTDIGVRLTIGLLICLSCLYAPVISLKWGVYLISSIVFLLIYILFSAIIEGEPVVQTKRYTFLIEDFIVYVVMGWYVLKNISLLG